MSWNQSSGPGKPVARKSPGAIRGFVAGLAVVVIGVVVFLVLNGDSDKLASKSEKTVGLIKEVKPAAAPKQKEAATNEIPYWQRPTTNGLTKMQLMKWKHRHMPPACYTNDTALFTKPRYAIFSHESENKIAGYLSVEPGTTLVGAPRFDEKFKRDFLESLKEPIIIDENDSEEDKALKKLVRETKVDLKNRMDDGEDLCQIMTETHKELQRLAAMKYEFQRELRKLSKDDNVSKQDAEDYLAAANKMLESKGASPIKLSPLARKLLDRRKSFSNVQTESKVERK